MTTPQSGVCRQWADESMRPSRGNAGTRERGSVDHRRTASLGALASSSLSWPTSQTAEDAGAPGTRLPLAPSPAPLARQPPRVAAANAARTEIELPGVWWLAAARIVAQGSRPVTGASDPNPRGPPWG